MDDSASVKLLDACCAADHHAMKDLLKAGSDPNHAWPGGLRLIHLVASRGDVEGLRLLLGAGADHRSANLLGHSAVHLAAKAGHQLVLQELHQASCDLNGQDIEGNTPLHLAMQSKEFNCARLLLWLGAQTWQRNKHGLGARDVIPTLDQPEDLVELYRAATIRDRKAAEKIRSIRQPLLPSESPDQPWTH